MTPEQAAAAAKQAVGQLGGAFRVDPRTMRRARQIGLTGWAFYVAGRGGALGDVRVDTVAAALGFIAPEAVLDGWDAARRVAPPERIAADHLGECCRWGREHLHAFAALPRLVELAQRVVISAEPAGMPLFAAWRSMPLPDDSLPGRAAALLHLLQEYRASANLMAVRACGLSPLEAVVAGPEGEAGATAYGWSPPFPAFEPLVRRLTWAEALTDRIVGGAFAALTPTERDDLVNVLDAAALTVSQAVRL